MLNYSPPVLNQNTWGMHINSGSYPASTPEYLDWLNPFQKQKWRDRGFVVWDATHRVVTHLYANYVLKILALMQEIDRVS
jgi:hypothetical protein